MASPRPFWLAALLAASAALAAGAIGAPLASAYTTISAGLLQTPTSLAVSSSTGVALVGNASGDIDRLTVPALTGPTAVSGSGPANGIVFNTPGTLAYATNGTNSTLRTINTTTWSSSTLDLGESGAPQTGIGLYGLANRAYVALNPTGSANGILKQVNATASPTVLTSYPLGIEPGPVTVSWNGSYVYVPAANEAKVAVIATSSSTVEIKTLPGSAVASDVVVTPDGSYAYLPVQLPGPAYAVYKIDLLDFTHLETVTLPSSASVTGATLANGSGLLYVAQRGGGIAVIDTAASPMAHVATIPTDRPVDDVVVDDDGQYAYATLDLSAGSGLSRIQLRPDAPTGLRATPGDRSATIHFEAGFDNQAAITNYQYQVDYGQWRTLSPAQASSPVTVPGLENGTTHVIALRAVNGQAPGQPSAEVEVVPAVPPAAPADTATSSGAAASGTALRTAKAKATRTAITTSFTASGPGRATITGTVVTARRAGRSKAVTACTGTATVKKAGTVRMTCKLTKQAKALRRKGVVTVRLVTAFTPTGSTRATGTQTVVLKQG